MGAMDCRSRVVFDDWLVVAEGPEMFQVAGLLKDKGAGRLNLGRVAFMPLDVAQRVFDRGRKIDQRVRKLG